MIITSYTEGGFKIHTPSVTILTEAKAKVPGRMKADIFIKTKEGDATMNAEHIISGPGEYEIKGNDVRGYPPYVYLIKSDGLNIGYFGDVDTSKPAFDPSITEKLRDVDIMFAVSHNEAAKTIRQLHPKIVVTNSNTKELEQELGLKAEKQEKLVIKKKDLEGQQLKLIQILSS